MNREIIRILADWQALAQVITQASGRDFHYREAVAISGGDINSAWRLSDGERCYFVKLNEATQADMFAAEAQGLTELPAAQVLRVPAVIAHGHLAHQAYLILEWIDLQALDAQAQAALGERLAALHRVLGPAFGWHRDNYLGRTPQSNSWNTGWLEFWREQRLRPLLHMPELPDHWPALAEPLLAQLDAFFADHEPSPSLLHGDLWGGNAAMDATGEPVLYDPAPYFGDRETDLAMTELFGGFSADFYAAYEAVWPLDAGYGRRRRLYQLYHLLNHAHLFGGGYIQQAERSLRGLLAQL